MKNKKAGSTSLLDEYRTLPPTEKAIVQLLAVTVDSCAADVQLRCLNGLGYLDNGGPLTLPSLQKLHAKLLAKGMLVDGRRGPIAAESVRRPALFDTLKENTYADFVQTLQKYFPTLASHSGFLSPSSYKRLLALLQIALFFEGSKAKIHDLVNLAYVHFRQEYSENDPLLAVLGLPVDPEIIDKIPPGIRREILTNLLGAMEVRLQGTDSLIALITERYGEDLGNHLLGVHLLQHHLVRGDTAASLRLLNGLHDNLELARLDLGGWLNFISGRYPEALRIFNTACQLLKKSTGKRKAFSQNYTGIFYILALLKDGSAASLKQALDCIAFSVRQDYHISPLLALVAPICHERLGTIPKRPVDPFLPSYLRGPLDTFFLQLFYLWNDLPASEEDVALLERCRNKAMKNGYQWLAAESSALLAARNHDPEANADMAAKLHGSCNTVSLVGLVEVQPPWQKTLNVLLNLAKPATDAREAKPAGQRLVWLFHYDERHRGISIVPRLQKLNAKGGWSKGRPVALKTLQKEYPDMPGLSEQDRQVCRAIREEFTGWYAHSVYIIAPDLALPALVGHPLVFLEQSPEVPVELVAAQPELHLRKANGRLKLSIMPAPAESAAEVQVIRDTPTRFRIIRWKKEHRQLGDLLGKELIIPKAGEKLAGQTVEALAGLLPIHSDLATTGGAAALPGDSRPHAHILPCRDGISLEFLVKPIPAGGPSFPPGKGGRSVMSVADGGPVQALRDLDEEKQRLARLVHACPTLSQLEAEGNRWQVDDPEASLEILLELKECGEDVVLEWPQGEKWKVGRKVSINSLSLRIDRDRDWFKATGSLEIDEGLALDLRELLELLGRSTGRFLPLDDGTFLAITASLRKRLEDLHACSERHGRGVRFAPAAALALEELDRDIGRLKTDQAWQEQRRRLAEPATPPVPSTLRASLRDYQAAGFSWLARLSSWGMGACLADDMGLGKTVQALAAILLRAAGGPTLVAAPVSVISNWQQEARRFAPTLNVILFGPGDRRKVIDELRPFDLLVVSYGLLPLEAELLQSVAWQTVVLDEAQAIKNTQTKRSQAAMRLRAEFRIITTGTPLENHLGELWNLFNFLNPGLLGSLKSFTEKFAVPVERDQDREARNRLRRLIRPFILRRLKSEVLHELPPKTEITLEVEMSREEQLLYEAQRLSAIQNIEAHGEEEAGQRHLRILTEIMKLRRLCCNPQLLLPDTEIVSSKLRVFADTLRELLDSNHKALVFSQFVDHLGIIARYLDGQNVAYQYLDGSTPLAERQRRIAEFQNGSGDVFLISLRAGGAGLNLTAADYVIHMDPWWNPAVEDQASDRAHRIGQDRPVTVYRLVMKDSIEQQIVALHARKRDLADSLLEGTDVAGKISAAELLALLRDQKES